MTEDIQMQMEHTKTLGELSSKVEMLTGIFTLTKDLHVTLVSMAGDNKSILLRLEQQGEALSAMVDTLKVHEERFDTIEEKMGSKETMEKLCERIDTLEKKDGTSAEKTLGQIKWLLITLIVGAAFAVVWSALIGSTPV